MVLAGLEIRPTTLEDVPFLHTWLEEPRTEPFLPTADPKETEDAAKRWAEMCVKQESGLTAVYQGTPVGIGILFLQTYVRLRHQAVHVLIVSQDYRTMGIGSELLTQLHELGRKKGVELIHVEVYDDPGVESFYAKHGYREYARQLGWSKDTMKDPVQYRARVCLERYI